MEGISIFITKWINQLNYNINSTEFLTNYISYESEFIKGPKFNDVGTLYYYKNILLLKSGSNYELVGIYIYNIIFVSRFFYFGGGCYLDYNIRHSMYIIPEISYFQIKIFIDEACLNFKYGLLKKYTDLKSTLFIIKGYNLPKKIKNLVYLYVQNPYKAFYLYSLYYEPEYVQDGLWLKKC